MVTNPLPTNGGSRPVPDPTVLTTEALQREIKGLGELLRAELNGYQERNETRFSEIEARFQRVEAQRIEHKSDTERNVADALAAQKEMSAVLISSFRDAATKSEANTKEQITQQNATMTAQQNALVDKVADLTARVGTIEAVKIGGQEFKTGARLDLGTVISLVAILIVILTFFLRGT